MSPHLVLIIRIILCSVEEPRLGVELEAVWLVSHILKMNVSEDRSSENLWFRLTHEGRHQTHDDVGEGVHHHHQDTGP